jgi:epsilon-lactone hydrolase
MLNSRSNATHSQRYVERAVAAGVDAQLDVWEGMPHGFIGSVGSLESSSLALTAIGALSVNEFLHIMKTGILAS